MVGVVGVVGGVGVVGVVGFVPVVARARLGWSELNSPGNSFLPLFGLVASIFCSSWSLGVVRGLFVFVRSTVQWSCSMVCERMKDRVRVRVRATRTIFPPFYMVQYCTVL